jgi:pantothenate kinase-related protein Tda10
MTDVIASERSLDKLHHTLSGLWNVPFTDGKHKFGLSVLFMILPGGSTVALFVKSQYVIIACRNKATKRMKFRIIRRLLFDWLLGIIPILGSILSWFYKADSKIVKDLKTTYSECSS